MTESLQQGLKKTLEQQDYDLVVAGGFRDTTVRKLLVGVGIQDGATPPAVAILRASLPFRSRFRQRVERIVRHYVPQLGRDERVRLVSRIYSNSRWDFDFIALTCLSTLIAALGLAGNQPPVVIGAMLVAPLMTPLLGAGLSLVQGNSILIRQSLLSVLFGFLLAFAIGIGVGWFVPITDLPSEILNRTAPGLLDLGVALVSGIAAAYAMSRPNLSSALPGVAIAAALVPPIATCGITFSRQEWSFAAGALLLFLTNIVAIVIGTAISLWAVGIRDSHQHGTKQAWTRGVQVVLLLSIIALGYAVGHRAPASPGANRAQLEELVHAEVAAVAPDVSVVEVRKTSQREPIQLTVVVESPHDEIKELPQHLLRAVAEHYSTSAVDLRLEIRRVVSAHRSGAQPANGTILGTLTMSPMKSARPSDRSWLPVEAIQQLKIRPSEAALVVVDHGSRLASSNQLLERIADTIRDESDFSIVEPAHMELAEPSIAEAFDRCVDQGARVVVVHPFFLLPGRHWSEDIPRLSAAAAAKHSDLRFLITSPLAADDAIVDVVHTRVRHCLGHATGLVEGCPLCPRGNEVCREVVGRSNNEARDLAGGPCGRGYRDPFVDRSDGDAITPSQLNHIAIVRNRHLPGFFPECLG